MKWTKQTVNNFLFLLGVAVVVVMIFTFDVSFVELWQHITHAGYWMIPIVGIWVLVYGINALSWRSVIKGNTTGDVKVGFLRIFRLTVTGYALNYATPVGGLGGEPYRIMELSKNIGNERATSSVILYAMMHIFAHIIFWFSSIFIYLGLVFAGDLPLTQPIAAALGLIAVFCLFMFYLFSRGYKNGLAIKTIRLIGKIPGLKGWSMRFLEKHADTLTNVDQQIAALHKQEKGSFYRALGYEFLSRYVQSFEVMFMLLLFGIDNGGGWAGMAITFLHSVLIMAFTSLFANMIGFLPMQIGVQEGGFVLSIAALGLSAALGIFVSIICRVREIIWIIIGLVLMKINSDKY